MSFVIWLASWLAGFVHKSETSQMGMRNANYFGIFMTFTHAVYTVRMVQLFAILNSESLESTWLRLVLDTPQIGFRHLFIDRLSSLALYL